MMEFFEVIEKRRSIRSYSAKKIEEEKLAKILDAINSSPSARNLQSYRVIIVKDQSKKDAIAECSLSTARKTQQSFISQAPVSLVFLTSPSSGYNDERSTSFYPLQDATIAAAYSQLAATALDLSSVWVGSFNSEKLSKIVNAKKNEIPIAVICIGYSEESPKKPERKPKEELFLEM